MMSSPVNASSVVGRVEICEEALVKTETSSPPTDPAEDFVQTPQLHSSSNQLHPQGQQQLTSNQSSGHFCGFGSPSQIEVGGGGGGGGYPLLNTSADIKWYSDFGCSPTTNLMGPTQGTQASDKLLVASSPPATCSDKSLPPFQDSSPYVAYTK